MTEKEICGSYRRADNKMTQIKILSELTLKSEYRHVPQRDGQAGSPVRGDVRAVRSDQQIRADGKL